MKKIMIIGSSGTGKSTLAVQLGKYLAIPAYHLDKYFWKPGWQEKVEKEKFQEIHKNLTQLPTWIIEGGIMGTLDERLQAADTIIYITINPMLSLWRIIKRRFSYKPRFGIEQGFKDKISWHLVRYILWKFPFYYHKKIINVLAQHEKSGKTIFIVRSINDQINFIKNYLTLSEAHD